MVLPRVLKTEAEILDQLAKSDDEDLLQSDDDGLGEISFDDEDGYDDGPEESEEVFIEPAHNPLPAFTPLLTEDQPLTPPPLSPGSQDMFLPSPWSEETMPQRAVTEPPAKRRRLPTKQARQQPNSGKKYRFFSGYCKAYILF
jgi:hypothetical protein